jgi:hypothetical protein
LGSRHERVDRATQAGLYDRDVTMPMGFVGVSRLRWGNVTADVFAKETRASAHAKERKHGQNDDDGADEPDNVVHDDTPC